MIGNRITHRTADGVRVPGTWRHAFICNGGSYYLTSKGTPTPKKAIPKAEKVPAPVTPTTVPGKRE
ncbi:DUF7638 domain-containing protein, partial [Streptomyces sp. NPDC002346]